MLLTFSPCQLKSPLREITNNTLRDLKGKIGNRLHFTRLSYFINGISDIKITVKKQSWEQSREASKAKAGSCVDMHRNIDIFDTNCNKVLCTRVWILYFALCTNFTAETACDYVRFCASLTDELNICFFPWQKCCNV